MSSPAPWTPPQPPSPQAGEGASSIPHPTPSADQQRTHAIFEAHPDCVQLISPDATILEINPAGLALFEASPAHILGASAFALIHPDSLESFKRLHRRALYGEPGVAEFTLLTLKGTSRWVQSRAVPIRGPSGEVTSVLSITHDISDRRDSDHMAHRLAAIVESSDDAIIGKDLNGIITSWNLAAERILGYTASEMIGKSILTLIPHDRRPEEDLILGRIRAGGRVDHFETWRLTKDGRLVPLSLTVSPIRDGDGRVIGASKIGRDISDRLALEARLADHKRSLTSAISQTRSELERSNEALRRSERLAALGTMAAGLGHDIGNLLLPMRSSLDLLRAAHPEDSAVVEACQSLSRCADYFASMVRGLRLFGRGEADDAPGDHVTLTTWAADVLPLLRNLAGRSIRVNTKVDDGLPAIALGPGALTQIVINLVKNSIDAFELTPSRARKDQEVTLLASSDSQGGGVYLEIADNGPGMPPDVLGQCMEPYFTTRTRGQQAGTGLGLALVHRVVTETGGRVAINSHTGRGTSVRLWLPGTQSTAEPGAAPIADVRITNRAVGAAVLAMLRAGGYRTRATDALNPAASLWVTDSIRSDEIAARPSGKAVLLLSDHPQHFAQGGDQNVCRIPSKPSASDFMRCLESIHRDRSPHADL